MTDPASGLKDFHLTNVEFLKLLAYKREKAKTSDINLRNILERECTVLESFYDIVLAIITNGDLNHHAARLDAVNEHVKAVVLQQELTSLYNTLYGKNKELATALITSSNIPTRKELESQVLVRNPELP